MQKWGLNGKIFQENAAQNSYVFLGCIRLPTGVKWCKSEGVYDQITPTFPLLFGLSGGVK